LITVGALGRDGPVIVATRKQVIALDPKTGADAWKTRVELPGVLVGRPKIDARTGTILGLTSAGQMVVISGKSGKLFAPIPVGGRPVGAPVPAPGGCLVATENKRLIYLWNKVKWSKQLPDAARASPLYANKMVYVPCGKTLLALRLEDGKQLWSKSFDAPLITPAYGGNRLYAGLQDGRIYALLPDKGDVRWVFATRDELRASLRVEEGTVFVASTDYTLYAIKDDD
jgi:outer membrane protein assembly factor BamB